MKVMAVIVAILVVGGVCTSAIGLIWFNSPPEVWFGTGAAFVAGGQCCLIVAAALCVITLILRGSRR